MTDILTITLNPAVDLATTAPAVTAGPKLRCGPVRTDPGGGGINVSRAIAQLGGQSRALVAIGGTTGKKLRQLLAAEGIAVLPFRTTGETRQSLAVTDDSTGEQYRFVLPGPVWDDERVTAVLATISAAVPDHGLVVLSGSLPPGVGADFPHALCATLAERHAQVIADTSGAALHQLANATGTPPFVLRMDQAEAEELATRPLPERSDSAGFAAELVARGAAQVVIIARGADGSVLATADQRLHVTAADVPVRSKVGAGDSFVGGFAMALSRGRDLATALQYGAAAASAAVMTDATQLCRRSDFDTLLPQTVLSPLPL
ncbi:1-phosphofructokinase family hexose kinase [Actibacterium ureilyticum]|uniref:1-phosphofructokinase family hexose kinase n=1 Tax=Actibacterium ureilyticum TaxID=1590614 RepID=UPI000BAAD0CD|nr:1-phosphofructokinase family hexose kinase [Actibacterium ureilyticum]